MTMDTTQTNLPSRSFSPSEWGSSRTEQVSRQTLLGLVHTAIQCNETRFAQRAALHWLASYPGDLAVSLAYAQALLGEGRPSAAAPILRGLCQADPEYLDAVRLQMQVDQVRDKGYYYNWLAALGASDGNQVSNQEVKKIDEIPDLDTGSQWGIEIWNIRQDLAAGESAQAEKRFLGLLKSNPNTPLLALAHMEVLFHGGETPISAIRSLGEFYRRQYPDCLALTLIYANALIQEGAAERGVALVHQVAARDISGQVVRRLWGTAHPYASLWPTHMEIDFDLLVPAAVSERMGWNRLPAGQTTTGSLILTLAPDEIEQDSPLAEEDKSHTLLAGAAMNAVANDIIEMSAAGETIPLAPDTSELSPLPAAAAISLTTTDSQSNQETSNEPAQEIAHTPVIDEEIISIQKELDSIAASLRQPGLAGVDGRYPIYVVFSVESRLVQRYGAEATTEILLEMKRLAQSVKQHTSTSLGKKWGGRLFLPDNMEIAAQYGLNPVNSNDPWKLKLALRDLDAALARHGEMIGALLIVGGPDIVPFHNLPNPVDDPDVEIPSDNPYGTRDENYFITEWPVGRIPGGSGKSAQVLLENLKAITASYTPPARPTRRVKQLFAWLANWLQSYRPGKKSSFGYTAAVWRQASASVYRPIGESRSLLVSPPMGVNGSSPNGSHKILLPTARLGYFNLHGLVDSGEWYGQKDPDDSSQDPDFPVALRPQDVRSLKQDIPRVVFTEACYGAHILDKSVDEALALQFLQAGSQVVVGSTVMSYGSIRAPLIAADLLGFMFWKGFQDGLPAGEALRQARLQLAGEMHTRQGYLDGEDQKTLISFVLYGDPLARNPSFGKAAKRIQRTLNPKTEVSTVCDRIDSSDQTTPVPQDIVAHVKSIASAYLPGMTDAHLTYAVERAICQADGHECPTHQIKGIKSQAARRERHVAVLSKTYTKGDRLHQKYARLTLDENGELVKIAVSR